MEELCQEMDQAVPGSELSKKGVSSQWIIGFHVLMLKIHQESQQSDTLKEEIEKNVSKTYIAQS